MPRAIHGLYAAVRRLCPESVYWREILVVALIACGTESLPAREIPAGKGLAEAAVPPYSISSTEAIGIDTPPTDLRLLPDGRLLVVAERQLALGDGIRWQVFKQAPDDPNNAGREAAVDKNGDIYLAIRDGVGRVIFGSDGYWRLQLVGPWPTGEPGQTPNIDRVNSSSPSGTWFWHSLSGLVFSWNPGGTMRLIGNVTTFESVFELGGATYLCDRNDGLVTEVRDTTSRTASANGRFAAVTSALPVGNEMLIGTYGRGLQWFDGKNYRPFPSDVILAGGARINDLCETAGGYYAAAVDNLGLVFFRPDGRIIQVLDRVSDQRLARAKRLLPGTGGTVWALLDGAVLRVKFPARLSYFEPLLGAGITTVHPFRSEATGRLGWLANGVIYRGRYSDDGRLESAMPDTPQRIFVDAVNEIGGVTIAGTEDGAYYRAADGWRRFDAEAKHLTILDTAPIKGAWLYAAHEEVGWLALVEGEPRIRQRFRAPQLDNVLNYPVKDARGHYWLELGVGRIARVEVRDGVPVVHYYGAAEGLAAGFPQLFVMGPRVHLNLGDVIHTHDEGQDRFIPRPGLDELPAGARVFGRVHLDTNGDLWASVNGLVQRFRWNGNRWEPAGAPVSPGFLPYYYTVQPDGVVWMHAQHRLARFDPNLPEAPPGTLRALITNVTLGAGKSRVFPKEGKLEDLDYDSNSLVVHYAAPGNELGVPVTFEVKLEGGDSAKWIANGSAGSIAFNRLKEGNYILRVRPQAGVLAGTESTLAFRVHPPWFRSTTAYVVYAAAALALIALVAWLASRRERHAKNRLEGLVDQRTTELRISNQQLAFRVEEILLLSQAINQSPVAVYLTAPDGRIEFTNQRAAELTGCPVTQLQGKSLAQFRADTVSREVLAELAATLARGDTWRGQLANRLANGQLVQLRTTVSPIYGPEGDVKHHLVLEEDITEWLADQTRRRQLEGQLQQAQKMESIGTLAGGIAHDFNNILTGILGFCEITTLAAKGDPEVLEGLREIRSAGLRARDLVAQILTFSRKSQAKPVTIDLSRIVAEALKLIRASTPTTIEIVSRLERGMIMADPTQIHQVVVNLCTNAVHAIGQRTDGRLEVTVARATENTGLSTPAAPSRAALCLRVTDNGVGMDAAMLERIFDPFYTTKPPGEGTGLGLAIVQGVVASFGGSIVVRSTPGIGSTFELFFPEGSTKPAAAGNVSAPPPGEGQCIMVVDDETLVTEFASAALQRLKYVPEVFNDPTAALAAFVAAPGRYQAILTDLTMPRLTGLDLLREFRQLRPEVPVIITTGYGHQLSREKLDAIPSCLILPKPFSTDDLARALGRLLNGAASEAVLRERQPGPGA